MPAAPQPGVGQQYILAAAPPSSMHSQKPGQPQMMTTVSSASTHPTTAAVASSRQLTQPMQSSAAFAMPASGVGAQTTMSAGAPGATYLLAANPMTGNLQMATTQPMVSAGGIKSEPGKAPQQPQVQPQQQAAGQPGQPNQQSQQPQMMLPQGMTYVNPQAAGQLAGQQVAFQGGQIIVRAAAPQDGSQVLYCLYKLLSKSNESLVQFFFHFPAGHV